MSIKQKSKVKIQKNIKKPLFSQKNIIITAILLAAIISTYFLFIRKSVNEPEWKKEGEVTFLNNDNRKQLAHIEVEVAANPTKRQQGLMYRTKMDEDRGMIFIFEREDMQAFWMKNTVIPLDIIFIDSKGLINTIHKNTVPYSEKSLPSKTRSQFVVEVNGGFCERHGIKEGDLIEYKLDHR